MHLTIFDFGVFAIVGLSALLSFFRGIVREMFSLGAWFGAGIIALYTFPRVAVVLGHSIVNKTIASGLAALLAFMLAMMAISMISRVLLKFIKSGSDIGLLDHGVGLLFGLARGVLVVAIGYFIFTLSTNQNEYPAWVKSATTRPYVAHAATAVSHMAPSYIDELMKPSSPKEADDDEADDTIDPKTGNSKPSPIVERFMEKDAKDAPAEAKKPAASDWPSANDLKQRIKGAAKGN